MPRIPEPAAAAKTATPGAVTSGLRKESMPRGAARAERGDGIGWCIGILYGCHIVLSTHDDHLTISWDQVEPIAHLQRARRDTRHWLSAIVMIPVVLL